MKSRRIITSSMPGSPFSGIAEHDKQPEKGIAKSRIPQMMSPGTYRRAPLKKPEDSRSCETPRPKSASARPIPAHPSQLLHNVRQSRATCKDRAPHKRPPIVPKPLPLRPPTPVINVPVTNPMISGRLDRESPDHSPCSNDRHSAKNPGDSKSTVDDMRRMRLRMRWQENIAKFEGIKRQLYEKQNGLLELYAILRTSYQQLSEMGQKVSLPSADELKIMNVAKLGPGELLQLCAGIGNGINEKAIAVKPVDIHLLKVIPNNIAATCEKTLNSRNEIIDWFEEVMGKKMITKNILVKKIKEFKSENDEFKRILDKNKEEYEKFVDETCENFRKNENETIAGQLRFQSFSAKLAEMNAVTEELQKKLRETEQKLTSASGKLRELEKVLRDERLRKREQISKAESQVKDKDDKITLLTTALDQANINCLSLEKTVSQLREENQKMQSNYDKKLKKLNESVDINTKLFDEIIADRTKLLIEKQDLEKQLSELCSHYEEMIHNAKHESSSSLVRLIETEKKYNESLEVKAKLEDKVQSLCAQLLDSELRFKEVSKKLENVEDNTKDAAECRKEMEMMICQLASANKELMEYKASAKLQTEAMEELEQKLKKAADFEEQAKIELNSKEKYILELETQRSFHEQCLKESELTAKSNAEELTNLKNHINQLLKAFGEFESWEELHEMVKRKYLQLAKTVEQNNILNEALNEKETILQQQENTITEQRQMVEERDATIKMLTGTNEEQTNIITLLRNNLEARTQADIELNQQIDEKNTEIESLISSLEKRKQQITQLEKIILTLEKQTLKLSNQKRTAREAISSLEKKLSEYESYYMINTKNTDSSGENLDDLITLLEYELANPSEGPFNCPSREYLLNPKRIAEFQSKRGTHNNVQSNLEYNSRVHQFQEKVPNIRGISKSFEVNTDITNEDKYNINNNNGVKSTKDVKLPKAAVSAPVPKDENNENLATAQIKARSANYSFMPNAIRDERKIKMFKLAGHRLQKK